jgi:flagellar FliJ protein
MTAWAHSLIRISNYEVETLQKRLAEVAGRRQDAEMKVTMIDARAEAERMATETDPQSQMLLHAFLKGCTQRRIEAEADVAAIAVEEEGARDALTAAFEELKKFEQVAENTRLQKLLEANKRETAAFDEMGLRRRAGQ